MHRVFRLLVYADGGGSAAEYGLVTGLIAIVIIMVVASTGDAMGAYFNYIGSELRNALPFVYQAPVSTADRT